MRRWLGLVLALALAACGGGPAGPPADTAVVGKLADIENWNPYLADSSFAEDLLTLLYPTLMVEQPDYREHPPSFAPWLAERWERSEDGLAVTFHLDPRAVWSDGVPVTADDVVFTWKVQTSEVIGWPGVEIKRHIVAVEAVDARTVRFRFDRRYPYQLMDANDGPILPAHAFGKIPFERWEEEDWADRALSAGPFVLAAHRPQQEIVLERNPRYFRPGRPRLRRVVWRIVPDQTNLVTQLLAGGIDILAGVPPSAARRVAASPRVRLVAFPDRSYTYIGWNCRRPPFDDPAVRRAMTLAIDRRAIVDTVLEGHGRVGVGPVLSTMWAFDRSLEPLPYDPAAARRLLAAAGYADSDGDGTLDRGGTPLAFELLTNAGNDTRQRICLLVQEGLRRVGVRVEPRFLEWGVMLQRLERGEFDAYVSAWREGTQIDLAPVWHSAAPGEPTYNWIGYADPEVDRLLEAVERAPDFAAQKPLLDRIQELVHRDQPYTFLYEGERLAGVARRLEGVVINDASPYFTIEEWRVKEE